jgi:hypothetical protein
VHPTSFPDIPLSNSLMPPTSSESTSESALYCSKVAATGKTIQERFGVFEARGNATPPSMSCGESLVTETAPQQPVG